MKRHTIAVVGLAVLLVASGTAIAAPTSPTTESTHPTETHDAGAQADTDGPPSDLPDAVPDHVGEIHRTIEQFLDGEDGSLGDALGDRLGQNDDRASNDAVTTTTEG